MNTSPRPEAPGLAEERTGHEATFVLIVSLTCLHAVDSII